LTGPLLLLITFRTSQAWGRFWEGTSLLHAMRGEWFDSASCLATFTSNAKGTKPEAVSQFRHTLLRLMSLCHGSALDELKEEETESYEVLDIKGLDETTMKILTQCKMNKFNRVEVLLHMIQVLVINAQAKGIIDVPPPILSRVYQTLSRGFVNLLDAKKIKDTRFPFPYAQAIAVLLLLFSVITPIVLSTMVPYVTLSAVSTFVPVFGLLCLNYTAEELEMPFGDDANDLPLDHFQEEMNSSLLMLIHDWSDHLPNTNSDAVRDWESLSASLHDARNKVGFYIHAGTMNNTGTQSTNSRRTLFAHKSSSMGNHYVSEGSSEYAGDDPPAGANESSSDASAVVAKKDWAVVSGHASKTVTQTPLSVEVLTPQRTQDPVVNSPRDNHADRVQALVSAAMSLQPARRVNPTECREDNGSPVSNEKTVGQRQGSSQPSVVGGTLARSTIPPKAQPRLPSRSVPIAGAVPASLTVPAKSGCQLSQEGLGENVNSLTGPSRWRTVIETPQSHKGDLATDCEKGAGTPRGLGGMAGQFFSGFGSNPTLPTREL